MISQLDTITRSVPNQVKQIYKSTSIDVHGAYNSGAFGIGDLT